MHVRDKHCKIYRKKQRLCINSASLLYFQHTGDVRFTNFSRQIIFVQLHNFKHLGFFKNRSNIVFTLFKSTTKKNCVPHCTFPDQPCLSPIWNTFTNNDFWLVNQTKTIPSKFFAALRLRRSQPQIWITSRDQPLSPHQTPTSSSALSRGTVSSNDPLTGYIVRLPRKSNWLIKTNFIFKPNSPGEPGCNGACPLISFKATCIELIIPLDETAKA